MPTFGQRVQRQREFSDIEWVLMACSDVKLACCRLCKKPIASDLGACIHCGVCKPVKDEKMPLWQICLIVMLVFGTILATIRYDGGGYIEPDCRLDEIGYPHGC